MKNVIVICLIGVIVAIFGFATYGIYIDYNYTGELVGVAGTNVYHRDNCKFIENVSENKLILFPDTIAAAEAGYRACKTCKPPDNSKELAVVQQRQAEQAKQTREKLADDKLKRTPDINKCEILGSSIEKSLTCYTITGTIKNNNNKDTVPLSIVVQAIFYDKNEKPIATEESPLLIYPGQVEGFEIVIFDNIENIDSYELQINQLFDQLLNIPE